MTDAVAGGRMDAVAPIVRGFHRLVIDDHGQDSIEYALLAGLVAVMTIPALDAIRAALKTTYLNWNTAMLKCWRMPPPGAGGGC